MGHPTKIVLYCHNVLGLGHIIRSARLADRLHATGAFNPILLTGCRALDSIDLPKNVPIERLTPIPIDGYDTSKYAIFTERMKHILKFIKDSSPDIVLVDTLPLGYQRELRLILQECISNPTLTTFVFGAPYPPNEGIATMLQYPQNRALINAYRFGMQYSQDDWTDAFKELPFKLKKVGAILGPPPSIPDPNAKTILVYGGGGTVTLPLLEPVLRATKKLRNSGYKVKFIAGPLADFNKIEALSKNASNFSLIAKGSVEESVADACLVISRCGYNSALALLRTPLPIIFIPYGHLETDEQFTRARELTQYKDIHLINPLKGDVSVELEKIIAISLTSGLSSRSFPFEDSGTDLAVSYLSEIAAQLQKDKR